MERGLLKQTECQIEYTQQSFQNMHYVLASEAKTLTFNHYEQMSSICQRVCAPYLGLLYNVWCIKYVQERSYILWSLLLRDYHQLQYSNCSLFTHAPKFIEHSILVSVGLFDFIICDRKNNWIFSWASMKISWIINEQLEMNEFHSEGKLLLKCNGAAELSFQ